MKKLVFGFSLAFLLLISAGKVNAQVTDVAMVSSKAALSSTLSLGSQGNDVSSLQQFLIAKGYLHATTSTGYFGPLTQAAVMQFQTANNLPQVGRVGPMTLALLNQQLGNVPSAPQANVSAGANSDSTVGSTANQSGNNAPAQQTVLGSGCVAGDVFSPITGQPCSALQSTIAGCAGANVYNTITGQLCHVPNQQASTQSNSSSTVITSPTTDPISVGGTTATLTGQWPVDVANTSAVGWFNYGTSATALNQSTSQISLASFANNQGVFSASVPNLQPNTTYYYEAEVAVQPEGIGGEITGLPVLFTTGTGVSTGVTSSNGGTTGVTSSSCLLNSTPSISVVSPNGGEVYTSGQQITVQWTNCNLPSGGMVNINLMRPNGSGGFTHVVTIPDASNQFPISSGSAQMAISTTGVWPQTVQSGNIYKILLDVLTPSANDTGTVAAQAWSANSFTIN